MSARTTSGSENGGPSAARQSIASMPDPPARLLVVEDEDKVARALQEGLEGEGYEVAVERTGEGAFFRLNTEPFDLVLLDVMLPGRDGLQILTTLRERGVIAPVLLLTARDTLEDRVDGLNRGADDYLVKPFAAAELLARIRAVLRRTLQRSDFVSTLVQVGDLQVNALNRAVSYRGVPIELTPTELTILEVLMRAVGRIVSRNELASVLYQRESTPYERSLDVHVSHLRRKLEAVGWTAIRTVRGQGYICVTDA